LVKAGEIYAFLLPAKIRCRNTLAELAAISNIGHPARNNYFCGF
jgi:hypothetical protein